MPSNKVMSPASTISAATIKPAPVTKPTTTQSNLGRARNYEIQRLSNGRWLLDSVADDKDVAIAMAQGLLGSNRAPAEVRVSAVKIQLDGTFSEVVLFHATAEEQRASKSKADAVAAPAQRGTGARAAAQSAPKSLDLAVVKASLGSLGPRAWLLAGGFIFAWCAIFYVWHRPQTPWAFDSPAAQTVVKSHVSMP